MGKVFVITPGLENLGALKTGGQGSVYKGRRTGMIITAVKLLPTPIHSETQDDKHFTAFQNEVNKLKKVNQVPNPNVVRILSSGITESGSFPYIEMEFVEGPDLEELIKPPHAPVFTIKETIRVAEQLSNALAHCHRVGVKHGDVKSNNVKYNVQTGNYVLLDFGMAIMSDEQRRTSLRHAGAVEFMAPEQNDGQILFETDIYSFGVVLFELLAGVVPFPLHDSGHSARHRVLLDHMEKELPDLQSLRNEAIPADWSEEKKAAERMIPQWLVETIYRCLQKKPEARFADGSKLYESIVRHTVGKEPAVGLGATPQLLEAEVRRLKTENTRLQQEIQQLRSQQASAVPQSAAYEAYGHQRKRFNPWPFIVTVGVLGIMAFFIMKEMNVKTDKPPEEKKTIANPRVTIGEYRVLASKAYFYNEPDLSTRRNAFMIPSSEIVKAFDDRNGFIYTEFTNSKGQTSKGWLLKKDLLTLEEWNKRKAENKENRLSADEIREQLDQAGQLFDEGKFAEALYIYNYLAEKEVPEAMYEAGNLGLQQSNSELDCAKSFEYVKKASDKGYVPAKRTLGFLYIFADNPEVLQINNYEGCNYERNVFKGTKLIREAMMSGDTVAQRLVEELELPSGGEN